MSIGTHDTQGRLLVASTAIDDIDTVKFKISMNAQCNNEYGHYCVSGHKNLFATTLILNQGVRIGVLVTSAFLTTICHSTRFAPMS